MTEQPPIDRTVAAEVDQQRVLDFLDGSSFGAAKGGKRIDTHASMVFLGGDRALKIKRAVRLPFLDYSTLEKRKRACEEELKVNAGNAPELYRRVVAITRNSDGALEIDGTGTPVEWAVEMRRFDEEQSLDRVAASRTVDPSLAIAIADAILRSHDNAPRADGASWLASIPTLIDRNTAKFRTVRGLDAAAIDQLDAASRECLTRLQPLLSQRAAQGFVRRCHGDLHLANIALVDGRPLLFDAIEFDSVIATTDILYDLAFTLMDLIHFNQAAAANTVFNRYLAEARVEDIDGLRLLPLFLSVRAAIRAHVLFMKSEHAEDGEAVWQEARRYFDLAGRLIVPKLPMLVAIGGLSGTGKSVLARGLAGLIEPPPGARHCPLGCRSQAPFRCQRNYRAARGGISSRYHGTGLRHTYAYRTVCPCPRLLGRARCCLPAGSGARRTRQPGAQARRALRRPVPDCGSGDPFGADRAAQQ